MGCGSLRPTPHSESSQCPTVMPATTVHGRKLIVDRHAAGWNRRTSPRSMGPSAGVPCRVQWRLATDAATVVAAVLCR